MRATSSDDMPEARPLTPEDAYKLLKLPGATSFDAVVAAKNKMLEAVGSDAQRRGEVRLWVGWEIPPSD